MSPHKWHTQKEIVNYRHLLSPSFASDQAKTFVLFHFVSFHFILFCFVFMSHNNKSPTDKQSPINKMTNSCVMGGQRFAWPPTDVSPQSLYGCVAINCIGSLRRLFSVLDRYQLLNISTIDRETIIDKKTRIKNKEQKNVSGPKSDSCQVKWDDDYVTLRRTYWFETSPLKNQLLLG